MSSEPERVFSGGRNTLSDQRSSLKSETVELPEYPHSWFRLGILTEEDLLAIPSTLNEHGAMEALEAALDKEDGWSMVSDGLHPRTDPQNDWERWAAPGFRVPSRGTAARVTEWKFAWVADTTSTVYVSRGVS